MKHLEKYAKENPKLFVQVLSELRYGKSVYNLSKMPVEPLAELFRLSTFTRLSLLNLGTISYKDVPVKFNNDIVLNQKFFNSLTPTDFYKELYHFFRMENMEIKNKELNTEHIPNFNSLFKETVNLFDTFKALENVSLHGLIEYPDFKQWLVPDYSVFEKIGFDTHMIHIATAYKNIASSNDEAKKYVNKSYKEFEEAIFEVILKTPKSREMASFSFLFDEMYADSTMENKADEYCNYVEGYFEESLEISHNKIYDLLNAIKDISPLLVQKIGHKVKEINENAVRVNDYYLIMNIRDVCFKGDWNNWLKEVENGDISFLIDDSESCEIGTERTGLLEREMRITDAVKEIVTQLNAMSEWKGRVSLDKISLKKKVLFISIDGVDSEYKKLLLNCLLRLRDNGGYFNNSKTDVLAFMDKSIMKSDLQALSSETQKIKIKKF